MDEWKEYAKEGRPRCYSRTSEYIALNALKYTRHAHLQPVSTAPKTCLVPNQKPTAAQLMNLDVRHAFDTAAHAPRHALPEVQLHVVAVDYNGPNRRVPRTWLMALDQ